jgi:MaoC dehydratase-like protein
MISDDEHGHGAPYTMLVERGKIREFAAATGARSAGFFDDALPTAPPTFLVTAAFWRQDDSSPFGAGERDLGRLLHGEQEFEFFQPPPQAGDELVVTQRVGEVRHRRGRRGGDMTITVVISEFRDRAGTLIAEGRSTIIQTEQAVPADGQ